MKIGNKPVCLTADGRELNPKQVLTYMTKKHTLQTVRANLMREWNKLEWADLLSGQADRHQDNYVVHIDPDTGAVKITGIDNDVSFGTRRIGLNIVDMRDMDLRKFSKPVLDKVKQVTVKSGVDVPCANLQELPPTRSGISSSSISVSTRLSCLP